VKGKKATRRIGLARALSKLGYCSRSNAAMLIRAGRVRLNGRVCRDPESPVRMEHDKIVVDDISLRQADKIYLMMNKPRGVVTTASDEKGRETVYDVLTRAAPALAKNVAGERWLRWIAPVGRLDKASEGLLLLTNDSEWGGRVAAPETHLAKTYHVQIGVLADDDLVQRLVRGVEEGGRNRVELRSTWTGEAPVPTRALRARHTRVLRSGKKNCWLEIVLHEGKNRQIRRMLAALDVEVLRLVRVAIGPLELGDLAKGACRELTLEEKRLLDLAMGSRALGAENGAHG
jgi:23S rRNA pseudouridine2605 synthase